MMSRLLLLLVVFSLPLQNAAAFAEVRTEVHPLERGGVSLHLERYVSTDPKETAKPPLLMVHGLTYSSHEFDVNYGDYSLARFFAERGREVWLLDIAGYGKSQRVEDGFMPDSDYAAEDIAEAARLIAKVSGGRKPDVLGWSWGTVTTGRFAAKYPELPGKLVLYAPIVAGLVGMEVTVPFNKNTWEHAAGDFQVVKEENSENKTIDYDIVEPAVAATFLSNCWRWDGEGSPNGGRRDLLVDPKKYLIPGAKIKSPTLLIVGDRDDYVTVGLCEELLKSLPEASRLKVVAGGAHAMMMEKPYYREFREAVEEFLEN